MERWCLRHVDYDSLDFLSKPSLNSKYSTKSQLARGDDGLNSFMKVDMQLNGGIKESDTRVNGLSDQDNIKAKPTNQWAGRNLRQAFLSKTRHRDIPKCIATWPLETLRLQDILIPEECDTIFKNPDELWLLMFEGLVALSELSHLSCLDLTGYNPSRALLFTMLQLLPLLRIPADNLDSTVLCEAIFSNLNLDKSKEKLLMKSLKTCLDKQLQHNVFKRKHNIFLPKGHLKISVDFLTISANKLSLLGLLIAKGLESCSGISVHPHSVIFRYVAGSDSSVYADDPLSGVRYLDRLLHDDGLRGLMIECVPQFAIPDVFTYLNSVKHLLSPLQGFGIVLSPLDFTDKAIKKHLTMLFSNLPNLKRVDLTGSKVDGELSDVLKSVCVEYINLTHCSISLSDVDFLTSSYVSSSLKEVDISYVYTNSCDECRDRFTALIEYLDKQTRTCDRREVTRSREQIASPISDCLDSVVEAMNLATISNSPPEQSSEKMHLQTKHGQDQEVLKSAIKNFVRLENIVVLEMNSSAIASRVDREVLSGMVNLVKSLNNVKHFSIEDIPLLDEDILELFTAAVENQSIQSLAFTRSLDAPTFESRDKIAFWSKIAEIRKERKVRISIENFVDEQLMSAGDELQPVVTDSSPY